MEDDDDNGRRRRRMMSSDDRALSGLGARRVPIRYTDTPAHGVPVEADDEITAPEMVIKREITELEVELLAKIGIDARAVATMGDLAKILLRDFRRDKDHQSGSKELGRQLDELRRLLETPPNAVTAELVEDVRLLKEENRVLKEDSAKFRGSVRWLRGIAATAMVAALGSLGTGAAKIYSLGEQEGETAIKLTHLERDVTNLFTWFQPQIPKRTP